MNPSSTPSQKLLAAKDYRKFIRELLDEKSRRKKINFSELSRRAGFSSRSFLKEVLDGKKQLTLSSADRVKKALGLSGLWATYFETLVSMELTETRSEKSIELTGRLDKMRARLEKQSERKTLKTSAKQNDTLFNDAKIGEVYASLGTPQKGANLEEVMSRCGLAPEACQTVLNRLSREGLIEKRDLRYYVLDASLDIFGLGDRATFQRFYLEALKRLEHRAQKGLVSEQEFFTHSVFCIEEKRMPELKSRLKKLLVEFLDESQNDDGDRTAKLTLGLYL